MGEVARFGLVNGLGLAVVPGKQRRQPTGLCRFVCGEAPGNKTATRRVFSIGWGGDRNWRPLQ